MLNSEYFHNAPVMLSLSKHDKCTTTYQLLIDPSHPAMQGGIFYKPVNNLSRAIPVQIIGV